MALEFYLVGLFVLVDFVAFIRFAARLRANEARQDALEDRCERFEAALHETAEVRHYLHAILKLREPANDR